MKNWKGIASLLGIIGLGIAAWYLWGNKPAAIQWRMAAVERGDINKAVTATGTLNPHLIVAVGTQVSGTLSKVQADFNDHVKKGQVLAVLDTVFLYAAVQDAKASMQKAMAQNKLTQKEAFRSKELLNKGLVTEAEWEQAEANYEIAKANVTAAQSQLDRAYINLRYATIKSPIDGIIIGRQVDPGQTVAASFNTPTLFSIADNLDHMEVRANVDEADIGLVHKGQMAEFHVDAYPDKVFEGRVTEIRLQPTTVQNVVEYTVILEVNNTQNFLLPGMTANISLKVESHLGVLKVPSAALKFKPPADKSDSSKWKARKETKAGDSTGNTKEKRHRDPNKGSVFVLENGKPHRIPVTLGLSDGGYTEVAGELQEGQTVIVGILENKSNTKSALPGTTSPVGGRQRF